jgi:hypothetical protein
MSLGVSLLMAEITEKLLYTTDVQDGKTVIVDRDIPFRLRYRLNKNLVMFKRDVQVFNQRKLLYLAQYGEPTEDGQNVVIKDDHKMDLYKEAISALVDSKVEHNIMTIEPEDLEMITDTDIKISPEAMTLFIGYMTNDPELEKDLKCDIKFRAPKYVPEPPKVEKAPDLPATDVEELSSPVEPSSTEPSKPARKRKTITEASKTSESAPKTKKAPTKSKKKEEGSQSGEVADASTPVKKRAPKKKKETTDGE